MKRTKVLTGVLGGAAIGAAVLAGYPESGGSGAPPSIEGTYRLVMRELPDGTVLRAPEIDGLLTFTRQYRNMNAYWTTSDGEVHSISSIARYTINDENYSEENIHFLVFNSADQPVRDAERNTATARVERDGEAVTFDLPLRGEMRLTFKNRTITASREGEFIDHWQRVE
ncbi:MAG: hypothetical protein DYG93_05380 [Leptolyngbya sp. PLA2]|nr:hypothetical protein [Leptolyngbya sp.]MCE7971080.1 hypothetical protein [Leptolyngbya sp. PL-A2]MCQ3940759.1 hypothetical protein [cyanobacterium CYA1]MCZ7634223.1 hypothetical protein [Phycisphaerales bacterium]MDL1905074.1 hypothetical protein [Synechococcales cyanobacterium CNB]GIK19379.1 MAG: hypothetical protein BroJett004_15430 [Planctomycetota bacterium]